jgi:predicted nicotinamide N-methyase
MEAIEVALDDHQGPLFHPDFVIPVGEHGSITLEQDNEGGLGGTVWDAAACLVEWLVVQDQHHQQWLPDKTIIETGSGTGAVGLACSLMGSKVTITDIENNMFLIERNVESNLQHRPELLARTWVAVYSWGTPVDPVSVGSCDILLGADLSHSMSQWPHLAAAIQLLVLEGTVFYLAQAHRMLCDTVHFLRSLGPAFTFQRVAYFGPTAVCVDLDDCPGVTLSHCYYIAVTLLLHCCYTVRMRCTTPGQCMRRM